VKISVKKCFVVLGIDTSGEYCSVGLADRGRLLDETSERTPREHSSKLVFFIDRILKKNKLKIRDINAVAVSIGPGSYTGLRVGVASAKALAQALDVPIVAVGTLDVIALNAVSSKKNEKFPLTPLYERGDGGGFKICVITDARKQQVYTSLYSLQVYKFTSLQGNKLISGQVDKCISIQDRSSKLRKVMKDSVLSIEDLLNLLTTSDVRRPTVFIGNAVRIYGDAIKEKLGGKAIFAPEELWRPKAGTIAFEGYRKLQKNRKGDDLFRLKPVYVREPDIHSSIQPQL